MEQINNTLETLFTKLERQHKSKKKEWGISTGFTDIDYITEGLHKGDLIVIASRPTMGKSTLALNIATNVANKNIPVAIFSLETTKEQYIIKMLCAETEVSECKLKFVNFNNDEWLKIKQAQQQLLEKEIYIEDMPTISVREIIAKCRSLKIEKNIELVVIDYLQLIRDDTMCKNREQQLAEIMFSLKKLAQELNIPIIVTSQLPRKLEKRKDKRPRFTDLSSEGTIFIDTDVMMFVYREDFYREGKKNNIAEVIIARNRYGRCTTIELLAKDECSKFVEVEKEINQKVWKEKE